MTLPDNDRLNFIIDVYESIDTDMTGGLVVLHKLAYKLAERGQNVFVVSDPIYKHKNIQRIESSFVIENGNTVYYCKTITYPLHKTITVYPHHTLYNPKGTIHVARWILYHTQEEIENTYGEEDVYFNFGDFKTFRNVEQKKLTVFDYHFDKLYVTNRGSRKGFCHLLHKHTPDYGQEFVKKFNSFDLSEFKGERRYDFDYLREMLNKHEYFLTYDQKSFFTAAAVLCGCKVIILNCGKTEEIFENANSLHGNDLIPLEYKLKTPYNFFGVAYGLNDIDWANKTIDFAPDHLKELEKIDDKSVDNFIKYWEKKI